jgi:hypothetical protein
MRVRKLLQTPALRVYLFSEPDCRRGYYDALKTRGQVSQAAVVAVARKILVPANALIRDLAPYQAPANSVC